MENTFLVHDDSRFCELTWEDAHVEIVDGWSGEEGDIVERNFATPSEAREFVAEFLEEKRAQGFREGSPPSTTRRGEETDESAPLFAHVTEKPDDLERRLVLADWLQQHGHARGHLIALQHALERTPDDVVLADQIRRFIDANRVALLGELADCFHVADVSFRLGFAESAHLFLSSPAGEGFEADVLVRSFLAHPTCRLLRTLTLELNGADEWNVCFTALLSASPMPRVESLRLLHPRTAKVPAAITRVFPNLRELVATGDVAFDGAPFPKLETLAIAAYAAESASTITPDAFPKLRKIALADPRIAAACLDPRLREHLETIELVFESYSADLEAWVASHAVALRSFRSVAILGNGRVVPRVVEALAPRATVSAARFREAYGIRPDESLYDEDDGEEYEEEEYEETAIDAPPESEIEEERDSETERDERGVDEDWEAPKENPLDVGDDDDAD